MATDPANPLGELVEAMNFATIKHRAQKRKGTGDPYIIHPVGVCRSLVKLAGVTDLVVLQAALLHDTVEDTDTSFEEIEQRFGPIVRRIVAEVTDDKTLSADARKRAQVAHAPHLSREAKLVKLADKLYNLRDLLSVPPPSWDATRIQGYYVWAKKVIDCLRGTNAALEAELDKVFTESFTYKGTVYPVVPACDLEAFLESYYAYMATR